MSEYSAAAVGRRVRAYRRIAGMTAEQLAEKVPGMTRTTIAKLENGHRVEVSTELLVHLAWALQVPPITLLLPVENPDAEIVIGDLRGSMELMGYWVEGIPTDLPDDHSRTKATELAGMVLAEYRQLARSTASSLQALWDAARMSQRGDDEMARAIRGQASQAQADRSDRRQALRILGGQINAGASDG